MPCPCFRTMHRGAAHVSAAARWPALVSGLCLGEMPHVSAAARWPAFVSGLCLGELNKYQPPPSGRPLIRTLPRGDATCVSRPVALPMFPTLPNGRDANMIFFGRLECVGYSFAYVAHFVFLRDVWIRTQRAAVARRRATNLTPISLLSHPSP